MSYAVLRDEWPAQPYASPRGRRVVILVNGLPGSGTSTLARQLAAELRIPLFSKDTVKESVADALWALLADSPVGGVVEGGFRPDDAPDVAGGLRSSGLDPATVPEVWCEAGQVRVAGRPLGLGLGPTVDVDTSREVGRSEIVRIALQVGEGPLMASET
ncbi:MAG TPA: hypothetical protein VIL87_10295 [Dermatophilaceae bacterium]